MPLKKLTVHTSKHCTCGFVCPSKARLHLSRVDQISVFCYRRFASAFQNKAPHSGSACCHAVYWLAFSSGIFSRTHCGVFMLARTQTCARTCAAASALAHRTGTHTHARILRRKYAPLHTYHDNDAWKLVRARICLRR